MKKTFVFLLAAMVGSAITIAAYHYADLTEEKEKTIPAAMEKAEPVPAAGVAYTVNDKGELTPLQFTEAAEKTMPAVVHIKSSQTIQRQETYRDIPDPFRDFFGDDLFKDFFGPRFRFESPQKKDPQVQLSSGSGVIITADGYIITNNHVIANADDIEVILNDNRTYKATVVGTDPATDLALIQIKEKDLPTIPFANSDNVRVGEWVLAVGNPFNLNSTVTAGIVSAKARNINILQDRHAIEAFIQTDAAINPGNSGGALVNLQGGLVGINTAIASPTGAYAGYGFAVPSNLVSKVVDDLLKYGVVQRGYLGVLIRGVDGNLVKEKDLKVSSGVFVDSLTENSAAKEAGIKAGDVILEVNGTPVKSAPELQELIARHRPGDEVTVKVDRFGKTKEFKVKLHNVQGQIAMVEKERKEVLTVLGADFEPIDSKTARKLDISGGVKVKKLYAGKLRKHTDMREGFIITKVDGKPVKTVDDLVRALESKKGGVMLEGVYEDIPGVYYYAFGM
ncbi:MAG TPA: Do family serine endopeptidase [Chitinophagales bacterium]|nr:Do family serine endopeptidase [Chitinophagales bacterium]